MNPIKIFKWWEKDEIDHREIERHLDDAMLAEDEDEQLEDEEDPVQSTIPVVSTPTPPPTLNPSYLPQPMVFSGIMPMISGWNPNFGQPEVVPPDPVAIGNAMTANIDRFSSKELGELILNFNKQLCGIGEQSFTRSGWSCYEALVRLFEEMTTYHED